MLRETWQQPVTPPHIQSGQNAMHSIFLSLYAAPRVVSTTKCDAPIIEIIGDEIVEKSGGTFRLYLRHFKSWTLIAVLQASACSL